MDKVRIGDICTVVSGSTPKSNIEEYWNGDIKWITPAEITDDSYVISDTERHITEKAVEKTNLTLLPVGTVLLSSRAPIGKTAIVGAEMYCNQGFKNLICSERIYNKYLYFFLTSKVDYLNALGRGATFKEISKGIVEDVEIPLPSLDEQKKIAERFEAIQQLLNKRKQALLYLDDLAKSRFIELFGDIKLNSKKWSIVKLEDIADVGSSKRVFVEELLPTGIPFYRGTEIGALAEGKTVIPDLHITKVHYKELCEASGTPQYGDLLMPSICPDGRIWLVDTDEPFYFKDGRVLWVHLTSNEFNNVFVQYVMKFRMATEYEQIASGTTFKELKIFTLKSLDVVKPPIDIQKQFADFVALTDKSKLAVQQSIETLQTLKAKLMQDYFG
ncbi:restriction endonuclease subunit S [Selenomonas ruminantium]|uniref:restriction endonuclease subunit S n=1 Tax=Selenomonas ruminantium TaxID=971 RepID=UPI0026EAADBC|nr:restriction endonuclease subunit S [Selenomonas ruminantium]